MKTHRPHASRATRKDPDNFTDLSWCGRWVRSPFIVSQEPTCLRCRAAVPLERPWSPPEVPKPEPKLPPPRGRCTCGHIVQVHNGPNGGCTACRGSHCDGFRDPEWTAYLTSMKRRSSELTPAPRVILPRFMTTPCRGCDIKKEGRCKGRVPCYLTLPSGSQVHSEE